MSSLARCSFTLPVAKEKTKVACGFYLEVLDSHKKIAMPTKHVDLKKLSFLDWGSTPHSSTITFSFVFKIL